MYTQMGGFTDSLNKAGSALLDWGTTFAKSKARRYDKRTMPAPAPVPVPTPSIMSTRIGGVPVVGLALGAVALLAFLAMAKKRR